MTSCLHFSCWLVFHNSVRESWPVHSMNMYLFILQFLFFFQDGNILHVKNKRKTNWIVPILCRNCLLKHVTGGNTVRTAVTGRWEKRRKLLLNDLQETRG
jgi:hypothetical protein